MNDHHMSAFITVIDCGSISKAARLLYITPQALSQQMDLLERECGAKLMVRGRVLKVPILSIQIGILMLLTSSISSIMVACFTGINMVENGAIGREFGLSLNSIQTANLTTFTMLTTVIMS